MNWKGIPLKETTRGMVFLWFIPFLIPCLLDFNPSISPEVKVCLEIIQKKGNPLQLFFCLGGGIVLLIHDIDSLADCCPQKGCASKPTDQNPSCGSRSLSFEKGLFPPNNLKFFV